jgi:hypothetical protein
MASTNRRSIVRIVQISILAYFFIYIAVYAVNQAVRFAPLEINDFIVSKDSEIITASSHDDNLYIYSTDLKLLKTYKSPGCAGPKLTIDNKNNIYMLCGNEVYLFQKSGMRKKIGTAPLESPRNWKLISEGVIEHFEKIDGNSMPFETQRLRRVAENNDILFYQSAGKGSPILQDPFVDDKGNKYVCLSWFAGIDVQNSSGEMKAQLRLPLVIRIFILPFPGFYLISIGILLLAITSAMLRRKHGA